MLRGLVLILLLLAGCAGAEREIARLEREGMYRVGPCKLEIVDFTGIQCTVWRF